MHLYMLKCLHVSPPRAAARRYYCTHHIFLTERALYILAVDISKYSTSTHDDQVQFWLDAIQDRVPGAEVLIVGTHADLLDDANATRRCQKLRTVLRNRRRAVEKKLAVKEEELDEALETLTDKREAFAMNKVMEKSGMLPLQLESIREIERVGQRADSAQALLIKALTELHESDDALSATERVEEDSLKAELGSIHRQRRRLLPVPDRVYPVSSAGALPGMDVLIDRMKTMVQDTKIFSSMDEQIPAFYTKVRRLVRAKRAEPGCQFMHATDYLAMMSAELGLAEHEVDGATRFLHVLGEVLYYPARNRDGTAIGNHRLGNVIFLKVELLIDAFKFIVRHDHADATVYRPVRGVADMSRARFTACKKNLLESGVLNLDFLERLWAPPRPEGLGLTRSSDPAKFQSLVSLLEKFEIAAALRGSASGVVEELLVPEFERMALSASAWDPVCPTGVQEAARLWRFDRTPPRGLMQRLHVKLCPAATGPGHFAKTAAALRLWGGTDVFVRLAQGIDPTRPFDYGLQLVVRAAPEHVWKSCNTVVILLTELFNEWPGLTFRRYAIHRGQQFELDRLESERRNKMPNTLADPAVRIADLIGADESPGSWPMDPTDLVGNEPNRTPADAAAVTASPVANNDTGTGGSTVSTGICVGGRGDRWSMAHNHGEAVAEAIAEDVAEAVAEGAITLANERGDTVDTVDANDARARVVDCYRSAAMPWVMIISSAGNVDAATAVFDAMTSRGFPCWMAQHSGCHATEADRTNDGLARAAVVCPVLSAGAEDDFGFSDLLSAAVALGKPVLPIVAERGYSSTVGSPLAALAVPAEGLIEGVVFYLGQEACDADRNIAALTRLLTTRGLVKQLVTPITGAEHQRERRKSFSEEQDAAMRSLSNDSTRSLSGPSADPSIPGRSLSGTTSRRHEDGDLGDWDPHPALAALLRSTFGFSQPDSVSYATGLLASFTESYDTEALDTILLLGDPELWAAGLFNPTHRHQVLAWAQHVKVRKGQLGPEWTRGGADLRRDALSAAAPMG